MFRTVASYVGRVLPSTQPRPDQTDTSGQDALDRASSHDLSSIIPGLSLSARFAFAATVVLCNGMALLGGWVVTQIERELLHNIATVESVHIQSLLSPVVPILSAGQGPASRIADAVDNRLHSADFWNSSASVAIWLPDGSIVYSNSAALTGRKYPLPSELRHAFNGQVRATLLDHRLLQLYPREFQDQTVRIVYTPLRDQEGGRVVAVVEFVTNAEALRTQLDSIRRRTWIVVGISTLFMIGVLFGIVQRGSWTIEEQRSEIERRLAEEIRLGQENKALRERLQEANLRGIELGEEQLRRIRSDLENGPAQFLALANMLMYELEAPKDASHSDATGFATEVVDVISNATGEALKELRKIASVLLLPEVGRISTSDAVERAIRAHESATGTHVDRNIASFPEHLPFPMTICIFRLVQEGLTNAYCHADGHGQAVRGGCEGDSVVITVSDDGPGFAPEDTSNAGLGLRWLRQRVESIGGTFSLRSAEGRGTQISARFPFVTFPSVIESA